MVWCKMLIRSNTPLDTQIIYECMDEIKSNKTSEELLSELTYKKLDENNKIYLEKFNGIVDDLYDCAIKQDDVKKMSILLKRLANTSHSVFKAEINLYKRLCGKK